MQPDMSWKGVIPALTTCFKKDLSIDYDFVAKHSGWVVDNGCTGVVIGGSLGEGATLTFQERLELIKGRCPVSSPASARGSGHLSFEHPGGRGVCESCCRAGLSRADGATALRLP
jgi:hypothetical protein